MNTLYTLYYLICFTLHHSPERLGITMSIKEMWKPNLKEAAEYKDYI